MADKRKVIIKRFLEGRYESSNEENSEAISILENLNPDFVELSELLESEFVSAQGAAVYVLYNRSGEFPNTIIKLLQKLSTEGDPRVRSWARSNLEDQGY
jgi:hypothetical protein